MTEGPSDETSLKGLAEAIKLLYDPEAKEWTADDVISLVDELAGKHWLIIVKLHSISQMDIIR